MIDFATLQGLTIPEGVVTEIKDASGRVLWMLSGGKVILEVEKITSDTYAGETTYTGEQFILLDIYPKTNGTVNVTYGGLTKTITDTSGAEEPNAQQVFFGTFNGVSDSVATPASGELTIEGDCTSVSQGSYTKESQKTNGAICMCVTKIVSLGEIVKIYDAAFNNQNNITVELVIPKTVVSISDIAFGILPVLETLVIEGRPTIGYMAFLGLPLKTIKMLSTIPPELSPVVNGSTGEISYKNFGESSESYFVLEQIIVPKGCGATYKVAEGWSTYANYIVEAS